MRVFIAEDEPVILLGYKKMIKSSGHSVVGSASDGKTAVEKILALKPDIILMDINLPELDGISAIKAVHKKMDIPAVVITGYRDQALIEQANHAGVLGYLQKPVDEYELRAVLEIASGRHMETRELRQERDTAIENLEKRKIVERAKGVLMDSFGMKEKEAMHYLQKRSKETNTKLAETAAAVLKKAEQLKDF